jgi:hypothetical protein
VDTGHYSLQQVTFITNCYFIFLKKYKNTGLEDKPTEIREQQAKNEKFYFFCGKRTKNRFSSFFPTIFVQTDKILKIWGKRTKIQKTEQ